MAALFLAWSSGGPSPGGEADTVANTDGASPGELAVGAFFVVATIAGYKHMRETPLLLVLGAVGLAAIVFLGDGLGTVPWWVWVAAAAAVAMYVLGTSGAKALTNVSLAEALLE